MTLSPCSCGQTPIIAKRIEDGNVILRVKCKCGNMGGSVFYQKPEDAERTERATVDGWNLSQ